MAFPISRDSPVQTTVAKPSIAPTTPFSALRPFLRRTLSRGVSCDETSSHRTATETQFSISNASKGEGDQPRSVLGRVRSTTWSGERLSRPSKAGKQSHLRASSLKEPPPFAEAFRHAILHARLEVVLPVGELERSRSLLARYSPAIGSSSPKSPFLGLGSRKRPDSAPVLLATRLIILSDDGCLLQYHVDGPSNRAPELVLELGPESIAVASDALPGRHWVLEVARSGSDAMIEANPAAPLLKSSKLSWTQPNGRKRASDLFLAFDDASLFNDWLVSVRTEIEAVGGLEYHPDSLQKTLPQSPPPQMTPCATKKFPSPPFIWPLGTPNRSSVHFQAPSKTTPSSNSLTRSSICTTTDLERLQRSSAVLDNESIKSDSACTNAESDPGTPEEDGNLNAALVTLPDTDCGSKLPIPRRTKKPALKPIVIEAAPGPRPASCSPVFSRTPTLASDTVHQMAGAFKLPTTPSTPGASFSPREAPFAFLQLMQNVSNIKQDNLDTDETKQHCAETRTSTDAANFDAMRSKRWTQSFPQPESRCKRLKHPPPPHIVTTLRKSSLKADKRARLGELTGLGIRDISPPSVANVDTMTLSSEAARLGNLGWDSAPVAQDLQSSGWHDPHLHETPPADKSRGPSASLASPHHKHRLRKSAPDSEIRGRQLKSHASVNFPSKQPRSCALTQPTPPDRLSSLRPQSSMPSLLYTADAPTAPPPTGPLPAIPTPQQQPPPPPPPPIRSTKSPLSRQHRAPSLPPIQTSLPASSVNKRRSRATTISSPSSPRSASISPAELQYAARLPSTITGFPVIVIDDPDLFSHAADPEHYQSEASGAFAKSTWPSLPQPPPPPLPPPPPPSSSTTTTWGGEVEKRSSTLNWASSAPRWSSWRDQGVFFPSTRGRRRRDSVEGEKEERGSWSDGVGDEDEDEDEADEATATAAAAAAAEDIFDHKERKAEAEDSWTTRMDGSHQSPGSFSGPVSAEIAGFRFPFQ